MLLAHVSWRVVELGVSVLLFVGITASVLYMLQVLFPNEPVSMMLAQMIGIIGPIDMEMLELGQETHKYFTDDYDLFTKNEVRFFFHTSSPAYGKAK